MFQVRKIFTRPWPVTVTQHVSDLEGSVTEATSTFIAHFKSFSESTLDALQKDAEARHPATGTDGAPRIGESMRRNAHVFCGVLDGWGPEVVDEAGQPVPYSEDALRALIGGPDGVLVSAALFTALGQIRFGAAPAKNAKTSPPPGPTPGAGEAQATATSA